MFQSNNRFDLLSAPFGEMVGASTTAFEARFPALTKKMSTEQIIGWLNEMVGRGYIDTNGAVDKGLRHNASKSNMLRDDLVERTIVDHIYEFAYNPLESKDIYYRLRKDGPEAQFTRMPVDGNDKWLNENVTELYEELFGLKPASEVSACINNIRNNIMKKADLDNGMWFTCSGLYWDSKNCQMVEKGGLNGVEVYREIHSTASIDGVKPELIKQEFDRWTKLFKKYNDEGKEWENFYMSLPIEYDFVKVWAKEGASGWEDRYWDTCIATSTNFMFNKPPVMYMLKGKTRNGKSTYIDHLHQLIGRHQTTDVSLVDLTDWSVNNALFGSLMNAPDEDPAEALNAKATAAFKSIATKAEIKVPVKHSAIPLRVKPKFMLFDPRNDLPSFTGDPIPCLKRIKFIFFLNDLSKMDNKPHDFWKETFVDKPETLSKYMGFILALAKYFSEHKAWYSKTMEASSDYVAESVASTTLYYRWWKQFYAGFESFDLLYKDYANFCKERGYELNDKSVLQQEFFQEGSNKKKRYYAGTKSKIWMSTTEDEYTAETYKLGKHILCRGEHIKGIGYAEDVVLNGNMSFVDILLKKVEEEQSSSPLLKQRTLEGGDGE